MTVSDFSSTRTAPSETIVEQVIKSVREAVRQGELKAGERLVVADLAERYGVSPGPVREAIRRLTGEGYLEFTPHKGASVRYYTEREVREIFQTREAIEGFAAKLAAENIHRADYADKLRESQRHLHESEDIVGVESVDARQHFHDVIYEIAGNSVLAEAATRLTYPVHRAIFSRLMGIERALQSLQEHDGIIEAILAGDGVKAERLMRIHLRNGATAVCEVLDQADFITPERRKKA
jgi:DNA-binding GntR family transcriptional regulator